MSKTKELPSTPVEARIKQLLPHFDSLRAFLYPLHDNLDNNQIELLLDLKTSNEEVELILRNVPRPLADGYYLVREFLTTYGDVVDFVSSPSEFQKLIEGMGLLAFFSPEILIRERQGKKFKPDTEPVKPSRGFHTNPDMSIHAHRTSLLHGPKLGLRDQE